MIDKILLKYSLTQRAGILSRWLRNRKMSPSFFIIGFQKCGTTSLYDAISAHPDVIPGLIKENDLLAEKRNRIDEFELCFPNKKKGKITGDASHLHTWMPWGLERIKKFYPEAKILVLMRNPVDRAYSHFNMDKKLGYLPESITFEKLIDTELLLMDNYKNSPTAADMYARLNLYGNKYGWPLARGFYDLYLDELEALEMSYLPIFMEDLKISSHDTISKVYEYLELKPYNFEPKKLNHGKYNEPMTESTRNRVSEIFGPSNLKLAKRLKCELPW